MVILLKSWRDNIVVKLFTTIRLRSWLVNLLRICWEYIKIFLRNSWENHPRKFPGIGSEELFTGNSTNLVDIFSSFSAELVTTISLKLVTRNSLDLVLRNGLQEIARNSCCHFQQIFLWKIPGNFRGFPGKIHGYFQGFSTKLLLGIILFINKMK